MQKYIYILSFTLYLLPFNLSALPNIQNWETTNGTRVYFVETHDLPIVDIDVEFYAGDAYDGNKIGLASLTNSILSEGADGLNSDEISEQFANLGVKFSNSVDSDSASLSLRSVNEDNLLNPALELFTKILTKPDFPAKDLDRLRKQTLQVLEYAKQSPGTIANNAFQAALYGKHPYATANIKANETSVKNLKVSDLQDFYHKYYVAKNAIIAIVGDLDRKTAETIAENIVKNLKTGEQAVDLPKVTMLKKAENIHIEFPSTQTHILLGQPSHSRYDPDYFSLYIGNYTLGGGGLVSRLSEEVREKHGLSYSTYSYFNPKLVAGPFTIGLQTKNSKKNQALKLTRKILNDFVTNGMTEAELEAAKQHLTGGFALKIDSNSKIINYIATIGFYKLPLTYLDDWIKNIEAVTLEDIKSAFKRHIHPDKMVLVTVGK
jgi:zinc protease